MDNHVQQIDDITQVIERVPDAGAGVVEAPKDTAAYNYDNVVTNGKTDHNEPAVMEGARRIHHERAVQSAVNGPIVEGG